MIIDSYRYGGAPPPSGWAAAVAALTTPVKHWYRLGDSGATTADSGSTPVALGIGTGIVTGQPSLVGDANASMLFPGTAAGCGASDGSAFSKANSFSYVLAYKPANTTGNKGLVSGPFGSGYGYLRQSGNQILWIASQIALLGTFSGTVSAGTKYLITVRVLLDTSAEFLINNTANGTGIPCATLGGATQFWIGTEGGGGDGCDGTIDEVLWLDGIISDAEIATLVAAGGF